MNKDNQPHQQQEMFETDRPETRDSGPVTCLGMTFENDEKRREYFLEKLREKLKDPEFRKIEGFPIGEDEDILALSDPPYYTACPNPFIDDFIKRYGTPYDSDKEYRREPFAADISEGKNDPVYNAHAYHTKVSPLALKKYIEHFTEPGQIVLDFFAGTGMTGVASQGAEKGKRRSVLVDLSPLATHVAGAFTSPSSLASSATKAKGILRQTVKDLAWMYETKHVGWLGSERDPRKRVNSNLADVPSGIINFVVWSDVFNCSECGAEIIFWNQAIDFKNNGVTEDFACPGCAAQVSKRHLSRATQTKFDSSLGSPITCAKKAPVLINYTFGKSRFEKEPDRHDFELLNQVEQMNLHDWHPTDEIPKGDKTTEPVRLGITHAHHFYTKRNLIALSRLRALIGNDRTLLFWFTATLPWCGKENRLHIGNYFGRKGGQITSLRGTWYIPSLSVETNVLERFRLRIGSALIPTHGDQDTCFTSTHSSTSIPEIPTESIDYIFVDPPFGHNLMYSELNCAWEAWLRVKTNNRNEAIINKSQRKDLLDYEALMAKCFGEGYRALKPGRWITVEFHNSRNSVWNALQQALERAGFVVADVRTLDKGKGSFNQVNAAGAVKRDLIISAYKPNGGLENRFRSKAATEEGVWDFVRTHLKQLPVFVSTNGQAEIIAERQHYLLFDRMVAFHVQRGVTVPMSAAEFYAGLEQRFPPRDGMYFLPDQAAEYDKKRMTVKEVLQLQLFVSDEASAIQWLKQQLTKKPQTAGDLKPQFMQEIGGWQKNEKMLELDVLLEQNFLRYDGKGPIPAQIVSWLKCSENYRKMIEKGIQDSRFKIQDSGALEVQSGNLESLNLELARAARDRWYVPDPNKAGDLEKLRERALMREFEEYRESKQKRLKVFRLEAVRAGFKKAWQDRDYATIIAVSRKIPEKILQEDPKLLMWYDQALTRSGEE